jgi:hypothetical protein
MTSAEDEDKDAFFAYLTSYMRTQGRSMHRLFEAVEVHDADVITFSWCMKGFHRDSCDTRHFTTELINCPTLPM